LTLAVLTNRMPCSQTNVRWDIYSQKLTFEQQ